MKIKLSRLLGGLVAAAAISFSAGAQADTYPSKPIRLVIPFAPGGATDQVGRLVGQRLSEILGQTVIADNRGGASGAVGAAEVARAKPDGYTLMVVLDSHAVNHHSIKGLQFDTFKDFDYLSLMVTLPQVLVAKKTFKPSTVPELIEYIKEKGGASYGSAGTASAGHVNSETLAMHYGVTPTHVPYRGAGPLLADLLGGHVDFAFAGLSVMLPQIQAGELKAIAISTRERSPKLPDTPTVAEYVPGFEIPTWVGLVAPAGLSPEVKASILDALKQTLETPHVRESLEASAFNVVNSTPEEFLKRAKADSDVMADLIAKGVIEGA